MKIKYTREFDLDLDEIADALMDAITDQLNDELIDLAETDRDEEFLRNAKCNIKHELYPILINKLQQWRINND